MTVRYPPTLAYAYYTLLCNIDPADILFTDEDKIIVKLQALGQCISCLLYTSPSPRD